jgi:hypothetical protein
MILHDYNGIGRWSRTAIEQRYAEYVRRLKVKSPADIAPLEHTEGTAHWVYPVMEEIIKAIELNDAAAIQIGIEFIEEDQKFPFGRILKSNTARALRRATLTPDQAKSVRKRVIHMLLRGNVPHEYKEYAKLLRKVGIGSCWPQIEQNIDRGNPYVMRYYNYLKNHVLPHGDAV